MSAITDLQLARMLLRQWKPAPGTYTAPAAVVTWDGAQASFELTGAAPDPAAVVLYPGLGRPLAQAIGAPPQRPTGPTISALVANYAAATAPLQSAAGSVALEARFLSRLNAGCRKCPHWKEADLAGRGRCDSVFCHCTQRLLWLADEVCPEHKWAA